jgi:hypothetical protein
MEAKMNGCKGSQTLAFHSIIDNLQMTTQPFWENETSIKNLSHESMETSMSFHHNCPL